MNTINDIPEITLQLVSKTIKGGVFCHRDLYNSNNLFGKLKIIWNWYWKHSERISWVGYLNSPVKVKWTRLDPKEL
jgi:hypothetical protein